MNCSILEILNRFRAIDWVLPSERLLLEEYLNQHRDQEAVHILQKALSRHPAVCILLCQSVDVRLKHNPEWDVLYAILCIRGEIPSHWIALPKWSAFLSYVLRRDTVGFQVLTMHFTPQNIHETLALPIPKTAFGPYVIHLLQHNPARAQHCFSLGVRLLNTGRMFQHALRAYTGNKNIKRLKVLVEKMLPKADLRWQHPSNGDTVLHVACRHGCTTLVSSMLSRSNVCALNVTQHTPFHLALKHQHVDIVKMFLDYHDQNHTIGLHIKNNQDESPFYTGLCAFSNNIPLLKRICDKHSLDHRFQVLCRILQSPSFPIASLCAIWTSKMKDYKDHLGNSIRAYAHDIYTPCLFKRPRISSNGPVRKRLKSHS